MQPDGLHNEILYWVHNSGPLKLEALPLWLVFMSQVH